MSEAAPLATVGVAVRNGAPWLEQALDSVVAQDCRDLDILISDNSSTDDTPAIAERFRARDPRVRVVRHEPAMTAYDHFLWVRDQARGRYFLWAAHDDSRSPDFVSGLARALDANPRAVLAFGDFAVSSTPCARGTPEPYRFETTGRGLVGRLRSAAFGQAAQVYGVWRTDAVRRIPRHYSPWWPDLPIMMAAACLGEFVHVPGPRFDYYVVPKTNAQRASYQDLDARFRRVASLVQLERAVFRSCRDAGGPGAGALGLALVMARHASEVPGFLWRRASERIGRSGR